MNTVRYGLLILAALSYACAGEAKAGLRNDEFLKEGSLSNAEKAIKEDVWELQIESGAMYDIGGWNTNYHTYPQMLTLNWNMDEIGNKGLLRGNTVFQWTAFALPISSGAENRMLGALAGPMYQFVQPGKNWVPFVGARVGFGFVDSVANSKTQSQGQDFCFVFTVTGGCKYYFTQNCFAGLELNYLHASNGGLSEPAQKNYGWNHLGPQAVMGYNF
jgi:opacity protein-like surface antigen